MLSSELDIGQYWIERSSIYAEQNTANGKARVNGDVRVSNRGKLFFTAHHARQWGNAD